jgi:hypothetical protein
MAIPARSWKPARRSEHERGREPTSPDRHRPLRRIRLQRCAARRHRHAITPGGGWQLNDIFDVKLKHIRWKTDKPVGDFRGKDHGNTVLVRGEIVF